MGKNILTSDQQKLLEQVTQSQELIEKFYLTGGTALSEYYFQHRLSEDLDFFSEQPLDQLGILDWVRQTSEELKIKDVEYQTLNGQMVFYFYMPKSRVKIDFAYYPFTHLGEFTYDGDLRIAGVKDIGVNKLQAMQTRFRGRDYFDLYKILQVGNISMRELAEDYQKKFGVSISDDEIAKLLLNVIDAQDQPIFLQQVDWTDVQKILLDEAKKLEIL
jgi:predicted nucleotidyltransferase component of viral defense system